MYKYRRLFDETTGELDSNTLKILTDQSIHISRPSAFNDPYDIYIPIDFQCTELEFYEYFFKKHHADRDMRHKIREIGLSEMVRQNNLFAPQQQEEFSKQAIEKFLIFCMSKSDSNMLLWSHYADSHRGISIGVRVFASEKAQSLMMKLAATENECLINFEYPVVHIDYYPENAEIPYFKHFTGEHEDLMRYLQTKSYDWRYEQEYRLILWDEIVHSQELFLPDNGIPEVIFGCKVPPQIIKKTLDEVNKKNIQYGNIKFYKMEMEKNRYALKKISI